MPIFIALRILSSIPQFKYVSSLSLKAVEQIEFIILLIIRIMLDSQNFLDQLWYCFKPFKFAKLLFFSTWIINNT